MSTQPRSPLGETEVHDLRSDAVGDTFRIFVAPCGDDPEVTLLLTDANGLFGLTVDTVRLLQIPAIVPSMLVVGVGYPGASELVDTVEIRARDLTPTPTSMFERSGGADDFIGFLERELAPWLAARHPSAVRERILFGHSLGGLFGTYVLLTRPELFGRYIVSSPSLWWDDGVAFRLAQHRAIPPDAAAPSAFFGIGSLETDDGRRREATNLPDGHPAKPPARHLDMVDDLRRFVSRLPVTDESDANLEYVEITDEFHATVPATVLSRGLRHFFLAATRR